MASKHAQVQGECFANTPKCQKPQQNEGRQLGILQKKSRTDKTNNLLSSEVHV